MLPENIKHAVEEIVREHAKLLRSYEELADSIGECGEAWITIKDAVSTIRVALYYVARDLGVEDVALLAILENMTDGGAK